MSILTRPMNYLEGEIMRVIVCDQWVISAIVNRATKPIYFLFINTVSLDSNYFILRGTFSQKFFNKFGCVTFDQLPVSLPTCHVGRILKFRHRRVSERHRKINHENLFFTSQPAEQTKGVIRFRRRRKAAGKTNST